MLNWNTSSSLSARQCTVYFLSCPFTSCPPLSSLKAAGRPPRARVSFKVSAVWKAVFPSLGWTVLPFPPGSTRTGSTGSCSSSSRWPWPQVWNHVACSHGLSILHEPNVWFLLWNCWIYWISPSFRSERLVATCQSSYWPVTLRRESITLWLAGEMTKSIFECVCACVCVCVCGCL